jgi:hypothetical protein
MFKQLGCLRFRQKTYGHTPPGGLWGTVCSPALLFGRFQLLKPSWKFFIHLQ